MLDCDPLSRRDQQQICRDYEDGKPLDEICRTWVIPKSRLKNLAKRHGWRRRPKPEAIAALVLSHNLPLEMKLRVLTAVITDARVLTHASNLLFELERPPSPKL